jgi:hypothetical protein
MPIKVIRLLRSVVMHTINPLLVLALVPFLLLLAVGRFLSQQFSRVGAR